jgi:hypothetical protein
MREHGRIDAPDGHAAVHVSTRHPEWRLSTAPGDGALPRTEAVKDEIVRQWDVVTPSATLIGRPERPDGDLRDTLRRLHDEQHPAMEGHSERMHRLDKARITHALCNRLDLTSWERDRVLGVIVDLDLTAFGSQRAIATVALITIKYVVDAERKRRLGLDDPSTLDGLAPDEMESLYDRFVSITDEEQYQELLDSQELTITNVNRLTRVLRDQIEDTRLEAQALGRAPHRDPTVPRRRD